MRRNVLAALVIGLVFTAESALAADPKGSPKPAPPTPSEAPPAEPIGEANSAPDVPLDDAAPTSPQPGETPAAQEGSHAGTGAAEPAEPVEAAGAASATAAATTKGPEEDAGSARVTLAHDTLGGHVSIGAAVALAVPFGSLQADHSLTDYTNPGVGFRLDAGFGVSRTVMIGVYGEFDSLSGEGVWSGKTAQSISAGPFVRYHLVQGVRFDPWIGFGAGFRRTSHGDESYTGIDFARVQLGGDFYGLSQFGFGPLVEFSMGTFLGASGTTLGDKAVNATLTVGGRFTFDGPGK
jgi:hypothetical protein